MHDSEIKRLLQETCAVRPGQEERAWSALRDRLYRQPATRSRWAWFYVPTWHGVLGCLALMCAVALAGHLLSARYERIPFASANSAAPGIYATSFYSPAAEAQVVWLNGLEPATDRPTYLDPSGPAENTEASPDHPANL